MTAFNRARCTKEKRRKESWVQKSCSEHQEKKEFSLLVKEMQLHVLVKEMQLHDSDYFFCHFRTPPVAFDKLLRIIARHSSIWGLYSRIQQLY